MLWFWVYKTAIFDDVFFVILGIVKPQNWQEEVDEGFGNTWMSA